MIREAALDMAEELYQIDFKVHVPGAQNVLLDFLSRLFQPGAGREFPDELRWSTRVWPVARGAAWWRAAAILQAESGEA